MSADQQYFPQHLRASRPYVRQLETTFDAAQRDGTLDSRRSYDMAANLVLLAYRVAGIRPNGPGFALQSFSRELSTALTHAEWRRSASVVFDFEPGLCEAFLHSDVDEICLDSVSFPFDCCYFHFGQQADLPLFGGELHAEGAFLIHSAGQSLRIVLAARYGDDRPWTERARESYQLNLATKHFGTNLRTAIDAALADDLEDLRRVSAALPDDERKEVLEKTEEFTVAHQQNLDTFRKAVRLVVNGLSYLTAYPEDTAQGWQKGTPEKLRQKAEQHGGSATERDRAVSKLISQGFMPVRRVGMAFQREVEAAGAQRRAHWRRGHWRQQAYGAGRALRRLIWVRPMRVTGGEGVVDHLFKVTSGAD